MAKKRTIFWWRSDRLDIDGCGDMGLASAGSTDQYHIVRCFNEGAAIQLLDGGLNDLAGGYFKAD